METEIACLPCRWRSAIENLLLFVIHELMAEVNIGDRIRDLRQKLKFTQTDVARGTGIPQSNLSEFETGKLQPKIETLVRIAHFFGLTISQLIEDESDSLELVKLNIRMANNLSETGKREILDFIDFVCKKERVAPSESR